MGPVYMKLNEYEKDLALRVASLCRNNLKDLEMISQILAETFDTDDLSA
jgi:hypothetical protein